MDVGKSGFLVSESQQYLESGKCGRCRFKWQERRGYNNVFLEGKAKGDQLQNLTLRQSAHDTERSTHRMPMLGRARGVALQ